MKKQQQELTTVTYNFKDNTKVVQHIGKNIHFDERGRKRSIGEIMNIFHTTAWDKGAISFTLDAESSEEIDNTKEIHFTSKERYNAKRDYKEFKKRNPEAFRKENNKFINELMDKLTRRLRFNLTNLDRL